MKRLFLLLFIFIYSQNTFSQNVSNKLIKEYEDTLKVIAEQIMFAKKESDRVKSIVFNLKKLGFDVRNNGEDIYIKYKNYMIRHL